MTGGEAGRFRWGPLRCGLGAVASVIAYCALVWWVLKPLHARGGLQPLTGFLNGLDHLLLFPGMIVAQALGFGGAHHSTTSDWLARVALSLTLYFWIGFRLVPALLTGKPATPSRPRPAGSPDRTVNGLDPDLVVLTGDYVNMSPEYIGPAVAELAALRPRVGAVAVLGNHDWWEDGPLTRREFARAGVPLLDNGRRVLTPDRQLVGEAREGLAVCGVGDLWTDRPDYRRALDGLPQAMPRLLLSHNPDVAEEPALVNSGLRVDWMLSGHTHGGQIRIPTLGTPVVPSRFGQK